MKNFDTSKIKSVCKRYISLLPMLCIAMTKGYSKMSVLAIIISLMSIMLDGDSKKIEDPKDNSTFSKFDKFSTSDIDEKLKESLMNDINDERKPTFFENIKKSIKSIKKSNNKIDRNMNVKAYPNKLNKLNKEYQNRDNHYFELNVNENNKNLPIFNLRSSDNIDFYWNFHLHNADNTKINNLILCRDIHQWMSNSSLSNEDLDNKCYPLYIIVKDHKTNNEIMIFEAYKIFVYFNENGNKQAFISKGDNFKTCEEVLNILIDMDYIKDLLNGKEYESYNLTSHDSVCLFLNNLLSHFLPSDSQNGEVINIDLKNYNENRETFDYFYHTYNCDTNMFNTNI